MKYLLLFFIALPSAHANLTIFDVRKNLPMSDKETVYRDFYINGGSESGMTVGMVITVQRRMPLYDSYQNRSAGDLQLKVARIKIIHVQKGLSVARLHSELARDTAPLLEDNFIMIGDQLDLASATSDKKADASETPPAPVAKTNSQPQIVVNSVAIVAKAPASEPPPPAPDVEMPIQQ
jgi:hypothetical protein